jgi:hypothetical protein
LACCSVCGNVRISGSTDFSPEKLKFPSFYHDLAGSSVRGPSAGKDRWFTLAAATALALGIGANAAVFTFVNAVLLRGLPFDNPDRIVSLGVMNARGQRNGVSYPEFTDWREQTQTMALVGGMVGGNINVGRLRTVRGASARNQHDSAEHADHQCSAPWRIRAFARVEGHPPEPGNTKPVVAMLTIGDTYFDAEYSAHPGPAAQSRRRPAGPRSRGRQPAVRFDVLSNRRSDRLQNPAHDRSADAGRGLDDDCGRCPEHSSAGRSRATPRSGGVSALSRGSAASGDIMVRTLADPAQVVASLRDALRLIEPDLPLFRIETMDQMLARQRWQYEVFGSMFAVFAAIALVLSSVGLSAVTSYSVTQRTQAIGAFGVGKILQSLLAQTAAGDPLTLVLVIGVLVAVAVLACLWPARRAARLDPMRALRYE